MIKSVSFLCDLVKAEMKAFVLSFDMLLALKNV